MGEIHQSNEDAAAHGVSRANGVSRRGVWTRLAWTLQTIDFTHWTSKPHFEAQSLTAPAAAGKPAAYGRPGRGLLGRFAKNNTSGSNAMRLSQPRIAPLSVADLDDDQREALKTVMANGRSPLNIFATMAHAPKALTRFLQWGDYVLSRRNSLPAREREILILRVGFLCKSGYEFAQHKVIGLREGLKDHDIEAIKEGASSINWNPAEASLLRAADELVFEHCISDAVWADLTHHFDQKQCMDVVFTVGQYTQVSMMLNSFGVQLDAGLTLDPDLKA
jgi:4-carboxymuconolactone decarboxylase